MLLALDSSTVNAICLISYDQQLKKWLCPSVYENEASSYFELGSSFLVMLAIDSKHMKHMKKKSLEFEVDVWSLKLTFEETTLQTLLDHSCQGLLGLFLYYWLGLLRN